MIPVLPSLYRKSAGACNISGPAGSDLIFPGNDLYLLYCLYHTACGYECFYINLQLVYLFEKIMMGDFKHQLKYVPLKLYCC